MKTKTTLLFPDTLPGDNTLRQLLLFCKKVVHYLPAEDGAAPPLFPDLCSSYAPVPFADELDRFHKVIRDLERHKQNQVGQLSELSLAAMSTGLAADRDEASSNLLRAALNRQEGRKEPVDNEKLWQARVLLKLAETMDQEEREITARLDEITGSEHDLLAALKGEGDEDEAQWQSPPVVPASHLSARERPPVPPGAIIRQRVKAWGHLFLNDPEAERAQVVATDRPEALEVLLGANEALRCADPELLFALPLPDPALLRGNDQEAEHFLRLRAAFQEQLGTALTTLESAISAGANPESGLSKAILAWEQALTTAIAPGPWTWQLRGFIFAEASLARLLQQAFSGMPEPESSQAREGARVILLTRY